MDAIYAVEDCKKKMKELKENLKDLVESSEMYKNVYDSTLHTNEDDRFDVSEKDAAKHAYAVTIKNFSKHIAE